MLGAGCHGLELETRTQNQETSTEKGSGRLNESKFLIPNS